jgi:hypothetical protein
MATSSLGVWGRLPFSTNEIGNDHIKKAHYGASKNKSTSRDKFKNDAEHREVMAFEKAAKT